MKPEDLVRAKELFLAASDLPAEQRRAWLDEQEIPDDEVRRRVEAQLEHLEHQPVDLVSPVPPEALAEDPAAIGPFRVLSRVAAGGMGVVYRAEQTEPVRRIVAVKQIKLGMDSRAVLARFEAERQALAAMDHPSIAKVFDAGTDGAGRPYFAMEFVDGIPINEFCDRESMTLEGRLRLFVAVCLGVAHAHQRGVIHRDLKPGNILVTEVDGVPVPKIIDFGIAKAIDVGLGEHSLQTSLGLMLGTPQFMSPEQADPTVAHVDTRSDVYSLGVLLYELLSGTLPFDGADLRARGLAGVFEALQSEEPPRPSTRVQTDHEGWREQAERRGLNARALAQELRGDLDWITMRALEKEREDRYESASALAADVERHLRTEPVLAGPPTWRYRWSRYLRRYRVPVVAAFLVASSLVAAAGVSIMFAVEAKRESRAADAARRDARRSALEAVEQRELAEEVTRFLSGSVGFFNLDGERSSDASAKDYLDHVEASARSRFAGQPEVLASILTSLGSAYWTRGEFAQARRSLRRALELRDAQPGTTAAERHELLMSYSWVTWQTGDPASTVWLRRVENARQAVADAAPMLDRDLRELFSWSVGLDVELENPAGRVRRILEGASRVFDAQDPRWTVLADFLFGCAVACSKRADGFDAGEQMYETVIAVCRERAGLARSNMRLALTRETMLHDLYAHGRFERGESVAIEALEALRGALPESHWYLSVLQAWRGTFVSCQGGRDAEALELLSASCTTLFEKLGAASVVSLRPAARLATILEGIGEQERAAEVRDRLAAGLARLPILGFSGGFGPELDEAALGPLHEPIRDRLRFLEAALRSGDPTDVPVTVRALIADCRGRLAGDAHRLALVSRRLCIWGNAYANRQGNLGGQRWLVEMFEFCLGAQQSVGTQLMALTYLADTMIQQERPGEAEAAARKAIAVATDARHPIWLSVSRRLAGEALVVGGRHREGADLLIEGYRGLVGWSHPTSSYEALAFNRLSLRSPECGITEECATLAAARLRELLRGGAPTWQLNACSWAIGRVPGLSSDAYMLALEGMRVARDRGELNRTQLNTLGVVEYRCGLHDEAVASLTRSDEEWVVVRGLESFDNAVFLAMCWHHLGRRHAAEEHLARARVLLANSEVEVSAEQAHFLNEAEELLRP